MNRLHANQLVPGRRYYIQDILLGPGYSGKKIGTFVRYEPYNGPFQIFGRVYFKELSDIPGAQMPSGLGNITERYFSDNPAAFLFFEPQAEAIGQYASRRTMTKNMLRNSGAADGEVNAFGNMFFPDYPPPGPGGGIRRSKRRRTRRSRRGRRSKKNKK